MTTAMKNLSRKLAQFTTLPRPDKRIFLAALLQLPLIWMGLRVLGLKRYQAWLQRKPHHDSGMLTQEEVMRMGALVNLAARHAPVPATCLTRSLLLCRLLQRKGTEAQLHIGVRLTQGELEAHAWVEVAGTPVNDRLDVSEQFAAFNGILPLAAFQSP